MPHEPDNEIDFGATPYETFTTGSGDPYIDSLLHGSKWSNTALTYSFPDSANDFGEDYWSQNGDPGDILDTFTAFTAAQQEAAEFWLDQFASVSGLTFVELDGAEGALDEDQEATLRFANSDDPTTAFGLFPAWGADGGDPIEEAGDVWLGPTTTTADPASGNSPWYSIGHELGHALGLKHAHEDGGIAGAMPLDGDMHEFTIMSYRSIFNGQPGNQMTNDFVSGFPQTLMMYDIAAIQEMYGANFLTNATDTTYTFDTETGRMFVNGVHQVQGTSDTIFRTIWDGNGVDTYDFSNFETNLDVDLAPGRWSDLDTDSNNYAARLFASAAEVARGQIYNALQYQGDERSLIENAVGGSGDDVIKGNQADNALTGNGGNDLMFGYEGDDTFRYVDGQGAGAGELADGAADHDKIQIVTNIDHATFNFIGADFLSIEEIEFTTDILPIFDATAIFMAEEFDGNPTTEFAADLHVDGNALTYSAETIRIEMGGVTNLDLSAWTFQDWGAGGDSIVINGDGSSETIRGTSQDDFIRGRSGNDTLSGDAGNDTLDGGVGDDTMAGGLGDDTYVVGNSGDVVQELAQQGNDTVESSISYTLTANVENLTLTGAAESNGYGNGLNNTLVGNISDNTLDGRVGSDTMRGGGGDDTYIVDNFGDTVVEYASEGHDTVVARVSQTLAINVEDLVLTGWGDLDGTGNRHANTIYGNAGDNDLSGKRGHDTLFGEDGSDELYGGRGADVLDGGIGNDSLDGGRGHDTLIGGAGRDVLTGGTGNDRFIFGDGSGHDHVTDFHAGADREDVLDVSGFRFADFSSVMAVASQVGDDVVIQFDRDDSVTLQDTRLTTLDALDFVL